MNNAARANPWPIPAVLCLLLALILATYAVAASSIAALAGSAAVGCAAIFLLPRNALPAIILWLVVLIPGPFLPIPPIFGSFFTPAVVVTIIWFTRLAFAQRTTPLTQVHVRGWIILLPFLALLAASALVSSRPDVTAAWVSVFLICAVVPVVLGQICEDDIWPTVRRTLAAIGLFLGILAAIEFLFGFNPWSPFYRYELVTRSVFRVRTTLGHPLTTSSVATVALAACVFPGHNRTRQWAYWICAIGASVALILCVSRTGVMAVGFIALIGVLTTVVPTANDRSAKSRGRSAKSRGRIGSALFILVFFGAVGFSPLLSSRNASTDGIGSSYYRLENLRNTMALLAQHPIRGFGPGTSHFVYWDNFRGPLENSALQLMLSLGIPALILLAMGVFALIAIALRRGRPGVAAGIAAFAVSLIGFNAVDNGPALLAVLAPLIVCAVKPGSPDAQIGQQTKLAHSCHSGARWTAARATETARVPGDCPPDWTASSETIQSRRRSPLPPR
jgi:hypothetical protein